VIPRRAFLGLGGAGLISCADARGDYFGNTTPLSATKLVHTLGGEPETLDPAKSSGGMEFWVIPALFEGLTQHHPDGPEPMAALATHYDASPDQTQFTFYLRGHPAPRGIRLPNADSLSAEFTRGRKAAPDGIPALWSDGRPITAHDFAYSLRRLFDPATAAPTAYQLYCIENAEAINTGKLRPGQLGVRALDDFTLHLQLRSPTPYFLPLITQYTFNAVPRHVIEAARQRGEESSWTEPENIVASGPFTLRRWRPYEAITAVRNPRYYDACFVGIDELEFVTVLDGATTMNLYKAGAVEATPGASFPFLFKRMLSRKRDFYAKPAFGAICPVINVHAPPLDNVLVRYALNMGTEKKPLCDFLGGGRLPAVNIVPPIPGYPAPRSLPVSVDGHSFDVLSFDVEGARVLLRKAGHGRPLEITWHLPVLPETKPMAEMIQQQWFRNLGVRLKLVTREFRVHWEMVQQGAFSGIAAFAFLPLYFDPNPFLDPFTSAGPGNPTGWSDTEFTLALASANRTLDPQERMTELADCERRVLTAMPCLPQYFDAWEYLRKPFVRGLKSNVFDTRAFKYAWIDTSWRSS
jgi:oligopeptide transport system substrate-binding protein